MISPDRTCFTFDARANGFVPGEGGAFLVLKRLAAAMADGDQVHAMIRGGAVNNDGATTGLSAPSVAAQHEVIVKAHDAAGVQPARIRFVELHGAGTRIGDITEALSATFGHDPARTRPLLAGSVKTNIGHLDAAAGVAGLVKAVISLRRRQLPPTLNFVSANPEIDLVGANTAMATETTDLTGGDEPVERASIDPTSARGSLTGVLASARLSASDVDVVEGHGTGTTLGDPIEANALLATDGQGRIGARRVNRPRRACLVGRVGTIRRTDENRVRDPGVTWGPAAVHGARCDAAQAGT